MKNLKPLWIKQIFFKTEKFQKQSENIVEEATDKRTDVWSRDLIIQKIDYGLWAGL